MTGGGGHAGGRGRVTSRAIAKLHCQRKKSCTVDLRHTIRWAIQRRIRRRIPPRGLIHLRLEKKMSTGSTSILLLARGTQALGPMATLPSGPLQVHLLLLPIFHREPAPAWRGGLWHCQPEKDLQSRRWGLDMYIVLLWCIILNRR